MQFCIRVVVLNRPYSANTQPIWKLRYPTAEPENLRFAAIIIFNIYFAFLINIIDNILLHILLIVRITSPGTLANGSAVSLSRDTDENHGTSILQFLYKIAYRHENVAKKITQGYPQMTTWNYLNMKN